MSIRFIYGRSGSGKTSFVINDIKNEYRNKRTKGPLILITPEQLTFQTEKKLINQFGFLGKDIDVLSFKRMANKVFKEVGGITKTHIQSSGKTMLLYKVVDELKDELKIYSTAAKQTGFVNTLLEIVSEFKKYNVTPETLYELKDGIDENSFLYNKISDLAIIYEKFQKILHSGYIDPEEDLTILNKKLSESKIFRDIDIWIDEFSGFTPQQHLILESLLRNNCNLNITLNMDYEDSESINYSAVFSPIIYTRDKLIEMARKEGIKVEKFIELSNSPVVKFKVKEDLAYLERNYFSYPFKPYKKNIENIKLFKAMNIYSEVEDLAINILGLCREKGAKFNEIAVITRNLDTYENLVKSILNEYDIPYFIDEKKDISSNNLIILLSSLMDILNNNWRYESVFRYLKTGILGIEYNHIDLLENYILESGIRGKKNWIEDQSWYKNIISKYNLKYKINNFLYNTLSNMEKLKRDDYVKSFEGNIKGFKDKFETVFDYVKENKNIKNIDYEKREIITEEQIIQSFISNDFYELVQLFNEEVEEETLKKVKALCDEIKIITDTRNQIIGPIVSLNNSMRGRRKIKDFCVALFNYLEIINIREKIEKLVTKFKERKEIELVNEYSKIWNFIMQLLDQMVEVVGEEEVTLEKFSKIMQLGFKEHKMGFIPQTLHQVIVSSVERLRGHNIKYLFILGVNDGVFPKTNAKEGILTDRDRIFIKDKGVELAKDTRSQAFEEQYLIYTTLTLGQEYLRISYPIADHEGKALRSSIIISRLKALFPALEEESNVVSINEKNLIVSKTPTFNHFIEKLQEVDESKELSELWIEVYKWFNKDEKWREKIDGMLNAFSYSNQVETIGKDRAIELYGENKMFSISRIENYIRCPFAYFVRYGLRAEERKIFSLNPPDLGTFMHSILDRFSKYVDKESSWDKITNELCEKLVEKGFNKEMQESIGNVFKGSRRYEYFSERIKRVVKKSAKLIVEHMQRGSFLPLGYEIQFGLGKEGYSPIELDLSTGDKVQLVGKIDRVDKLIYEGEEYFRVIDYKSGNKEFKLWEVYYGLQVQLLTYLDAILEKEGEKLNFPVFPAGILYFKIDNPIIKKDKNLSDEELEKEIMKALKMKGLILADTKIVREMDREIEGASLILPVGFKKDGDFSKISHIATKEQFELLREHVKSKLINSCEDMLEGVIDIGPCMTKIGTACEYCAYSSICTFDLAMQDNEYKILKEKSDEEVWKLLNEEKEERENGGY